MYFYNWCRMAFNVCNERYGLWGKPDMDFYSLSHDFYLRLAIDGWRSPQRRNKGMKLSTWMVNGFRYVVLDRLKADARHEQDSGLANIDVSDDGLYAEVQSLLNDVIEGCYAGDATAQTILRSILIEGYSGKETAERLGITPSAVSQRFTAMMNDTVKPFIMRNITAETAFLSVKENRSASYAFDEYMPTPGGAGAFDEIVTTSETSEKYSSSQDMIEKLLSKFRLHKPNVLEEDYPDESMQIPSGRIAPEVILKLADDEIFVFGSNLQGMHGGGAARIAHKSFGAEWGVGVGLTGRTYAIPTMQGGTETIRPYVDDFIAFAREHPEMRFLVTRIGCGIAGFDDEDIAPLFADAVDVDNISLPEKFWGILLS